MIVFEHLCRLNELFFCFLKFNHRGSLRRLRRFCFLSINNTQFNLWFHFYSFFWWNLNTSNTLSDLAFAFLNNDRYFFYYCFFDNLWDFFNNYFLYDLYLFWFWFNYNLNFLFCMLIFRNFNLHLFQKRSALTTFHRWRSAILRIFVHWW
jgi:hypothetical protein